MRIEAAQRRIQAFERKFKPPHLFLAAHAAVPLALTPDLLYRIWVNFQRDLEGKPCTIPRIAVSDLLLSSLCDEVGYELFEMEDTIRHELLQKLSQNQRQQVAEFLWQYVQSDLKSHDGYYREFAQSQSWAAQAYRNPEEAIELLAAAINTAYRENPDDLMRLTTLTELFQQDVPEFDKLLIYARAIGHAARNRFKEAKGEMIKLPFSNGRIDLGKNIIIHIAEEILDHLNHQEYNETNKFHDNDSLDYESISTLDETLKKLAIAAQQYPPKSLERKKILEKLIKTLINSDKLAKPRGDNFKHLYTEIYTEAKQRLFIYISQKIDDYDPEKGDVLQWVNYLLKNRFFAESVKFILRSRANRIVIQ